VILLVSLLQVVAPGHTREDSVTAAVYAAILEQEFVRPDTRLLLVEPHTAPGHGHVDNFDYQTALTALGPLPAGLQTSFESRRQLRLPVAVAELPTPVPAVPFTSADAATLPRADPAAYWEAFAERFPGAEGTVLFSPVGLSADGATALVMVDVRCGPRCGATRYYLLRRQGDRWIKTRGATVRMS
jgi:hypothetical protein